MISSKMTLLTSVIVSVLRGASSVGLFVVDWGWTRFDDNVLRRGSASLAVLFVLCAWCLLKALWSPFALRALAPSALHQVANAAEWNSVVVFMVSLCPNVMHFFACSSQSHALCFQAVVSAVIVILLRFSFQATAIAVFGLGQSATLPDLSSLLGVVSVSLVSLGVDEVIHVCDSNWMETREPALTQAGNVPHPRPTTASGPLGAANRPHSLHFDAALLGTKLVLSTAQYYMGLQWKTLFVTSMILLAVRFVYSTFGASGGPHPLNDCVCNRGCCPHQRYRRVRSVEATNGPTLAAQPESATTNHAVAVLQQPVGDLLRQFRRHGAAYAHVAGGLLVSSVFVCLPVALVLVSQSGLAASALSNAAGVSLSSFWSTDFVVLYFGVVFAVVLKIGDHMLEPLASRIQDEPQSGRSISGGLPGIVFCAAGFSIILSFCWLGLCWMVSSKEDWNSSGTLLLIIVSLALAISDSVRHVLSQTLHMLAAPWQYNVVICMVGAVVMIGSVLVEFSTREYECAFQYGGCGTKLGWLGAVIVANVVAAGVLACVLCLDNDVCCSSNGGPMWSGAFKRIEAAWFRHHEVAYTTVNTDAANLVLDSRSPTVGERASTWELEEFVSVVSDGGETSSDSNASANRNDADGDTGPGDSASGLLTKHKLSQGMLIEKVDCRDDIDGTLEKPKMVRIKTDKGLRMKVRTYNKKVVLLDPHMTTFDL